MTNLKKALAADEHGPANWVWVLGLFLTALGARLWLIHAFGTSLPFWDQWEETRYIFVPYFEGRLSWSALISPHNEHRILFTRLYDLALLLLDGQWDNQVQMVGNTLFYTAGLAGGGWLLAKTLGRRYWPVIATALLLLLCLPFTWENTLAGFQSQVYLVILTMLATIWFLGFYDFKNPRWWLGALLAFVSLFAMGSGLLGAATVIALIGMRAVRNRTFPKSQWPTVAVALAAMILGLALKVEVPYHQELKAHSAGDFLISLGKYLAWPLIVLPPYALISMFPLALLAWIYWRHRNTEMRREEIVLALGIWAVAQAAASAYTRGASGGYPQWRYMDGTGFIMIANILALALLVTEHRDRLPLRRFAKLGAGLWAFACLAGMLALSARAGAVDIPARATQHRFQLETLRAYLATGDPAALQVDDKAKLSRFAAPNEPQDHPKALMDMLAPAKVRAILPACARVPLLMLPSTVTGFSSNATAFAQPPVVGETFWQGGAGKNRFESQPLAPTKFPYLEFSVSGGLGEIPPSLAIVELSSGKSTAFNPSAAANRWNRVAVPMPRSEFKVVAESDSAVHGFSFQPPRELGRLSYWSRRLTTAGMGIFIVGLWVIFAIAVVVFTSRARPASP